MAKEEPRKPEDEKKLKAKKRELDDLPPKEADEQDVKGGRAPPYVPVGPNRDA
jgi:hypothetical protein